jgi:dihydrofolate reductase
MRRLRYSVAMSLDGYIADENGGYDWIVMDPAIDFAAFTAKIDTLIMGRGTYEIAAGGGPGFGKDTKVYVVSTTLDPAEHPKVTIVSKDVEKTVAELKAHPGKDIWLFGGGVLFRSLLEAGLVDRVEVGVMPVLLGQGIPLLPGFGGTRPGGGGGDGGRGPSGKGKKTGAWAKLRLHGVEEMPETGILLIKYDVVN